MIRALLVGSFLSFQLQAAEAPPAFADVLTILEVGLVVDGGWFQVAGVQALLVDNVTVNNVTLRANNGQAKK